jgi:Na+/H+ antiporter NhaC
MLVYTVIGIKEVEVSATPDTDIVSVLPYLFVLISAMAGMNVMLVLSFGVVFTGIIGMIQGSFDLTGWMNAMSEGMLGMGELIIVTLMAAGLIHVIRKKGGIQYLLERITSRINGRMGAEFSIATLVTLTNFCTANNTIAILTVGPIAKDISTHYGVDPRRSASILDSFASFAQGLIPYGAQMLIACGLSTLNPLEVIPYLFYPFILGVVSILNIFIYNKSNK